MQLQNLVLPRKCIPVQEVPQSGRHQCPTYRPGLRQLAALGKIKIGGPSTLAPTSNFSKKKMHMQTHMCWVYM